MSNLVNLTVEFSKPTKKNSFFTKLIEAGTTKQTAFGPIKTPKRTYYMFLEQQQAKGFSADLDLDHFNIYEEAYEIMDDDGAPKEIMLKKLVLKK